MTTSSILFQLVNYGYNQEHCNVIRGSTIFTNTEHLILRTGLYLQFIHSQNDVQMSIIYAPSEIYFTDTPRDTIV